MENNRYLLKLFAALAILILAVNAAVLHFGFGIRFSDLADFVVHAAGDGSAKTFDDPAGNRSSERNGLSGIGDGSSEMLTLDRGWTGEGGDSPAESWDTPAGAGDSPAKGQITERDGPSEMSDSYPQDETAREGGSSENETEGDSPAPYDVVLEAMKKLSFGDKIFLYGILARIGRNELDEIVNIARDGITGDEIEKIKAYAGEFLKPADIAKLEDMLARYGHMYAEAGK